MNEITCSQRYEHLKLERDLYLDRARDVSKLTLPTVFPEEYFSSSSEIKTPYQSLGARAVNNLASKLLLALLPPNTPFFKFSLTDLEKEGIDAQFEGLSTEIAKAFSALEQQIVSEIESSTIRLGMYQAFVQLIISGNSLIFMEDLKNVRVFKLSNYVIQRDSSGNVLEIIVKETVAREALPDRFKDLDIEKLESSSSVSSPIPQVDVFTKIKKIAKDKYIVFKEIGEEVIEDTVKTYKSNELPYIALRFNRIDGESYGRGYAEEYLGDLVSLEGLTKAIVEASSIASKTIFLANPAGTVSIRELAQAANGAVIKGNVEDVSVLRVDKSADFRFAFETAGAIQQRLAGVFLLNSSIQRDAERVTAEEIRLMARELEEALGGIYSIMSQEFQLPLVEFLVSHLEKKDKMPKLPKELVKITISTGLEALGRGHDLQKLNAFLANVSQMGEQDFSLINLQDYIQRVALSLGLNIQGLVKTQEQLQAEQEAALQNNPEVIKQTGNIIQEEMRNEREAG